MKIKMKAEFEKKLAELGFLYNSNSDDFYLFHANNDVDRYLNVQFICTERVDEIKYGSHNGNEIESIGLFISKLNTSENESDFIIFAFQNSKKNQIEYVIIPSNELKQRLTTENRTLKRNHIYKNVFWLMPDGFIYNCTDIGIEGEWFYLSKGEYGITTDDTEWDYNKYLNAWDKLIRFNSL